MSGQVKFSSMPEALSVKSSDRLPLLVPTSTNKNQTISLAEMFGDFPVPVKYTGTVIHQQTPDIISSNGAFTSLSKYALLENNSASAITTNLMNGIDGQELILVGKSMVSDVNVTPVSTLGFTSIRFVQVGSTATLRFIGSTWVIISAHNVTIT